MGLRVAIADDEPTFLRMFVAMLDHDFEIVATATDGHSAWASISDSRPDVVILDLQLPHLNGIELTHRLKSSGNHVNIVICSVINDPDIIEAVLQAGASGYVWKERIATDLVIAIKAAADGQQFVSAVC